MKIKYLPTGNVFDLPEAEARRIYIEDRGINYEILDGEIKIEDKPIEETPVYNQIIEEENKTEDEIKEKEKPLTELTIKELKTKLDKVGISYSKNAKKEDLLALFKDNEIKEGA